MWPTRLKLSAVFNPVASKGPIIQIARGFQARDCTLLCFWGNGFFTLEILLNLLPTARTITEISHRLIESPHNRIKIAQLYNLLLREGLAFPQRGCVQLI